MMPAEIWVIRENDVQDAVEIALDRYPGVDRQESISWGKKRFDHPDLIILKSLNGVICVSITRVFWRPAEVGASVVFFCTRRSAGSWEAFYLLKGAVAAAKKRGATVFHLGSNTGVDFSPLAKRLGLNLLCLGYEGKI